MRLALALQQHPANCSADPWLGTYVLNIDLALASYFDQMVGECDGVPDRAEDLSAQLWLCRLFRWEGTPLLVFTESTNKAL